MFLTFNIIILVLGLVLYLFVTGIWKMSSREALKNQELIVSKSGRMLKVVALVSMAMASVNIVYQLIN